MYKHRAHEPGWHPGRSSTLVHKDHVGLALGTQRCGPEALLQALLAMPCLTLEGGLSAAGGLPGLLVQWFMGKSTTSMVVLISQDDDTEIENSPLSFDSGPLPWGIKGIQEKFPRGQMPFLQLLPPFENGQWARSCRGHPPLHRERRPPCLFWAFHL